MFQNFKHFSVIVLKYKDGYQGWNSQIANWEDLDQTEETVWSGSALFI